MFIFGLGALVFAGFLAWAVYKEHQSAPPKTWGDWASEAALWGGIACTVFVAVAAFF